MQLIMGHMLCMLCPSPHGVCILHLQLTNYNHNMIGAKDVLVITELDVLSSGSTDMQVRDAVTVFVACCMNMLPA